MRVVLVCKDAERADWVAHVLGEAGFSVVVLSDVSPASPELRGAELIITDGEAARALGTSGPARRLLLSSRGATVDLAVIEGRFSDILALPASKEEVIARVRHVMNS
jgi:DNA-binding response OmpR family regulator